MYYQAAQGGTHGRVSVLDSYYDKWCVGWLGEPGMEWLMAPDDPYLPLAQEMAALDARLLPAADVVIVLEIAEAHWHDQLAVRGRTIDRSPLFLRSYRTEELMVRTALERGPRDRTQVLRYRRTRRPPETEALALVDLMRAHGIELT